MQKYSVNLILWSQINEDRQYPIYIRISLAGKKSYISTGYAIEKNHWDKKNQQIKPTHKNYNVWNPDIQDKLNKITRRIVELQIANKPFTALSIKQYFSAKDLTNIFQFAEAFIKEVGLKREDSTLENYRKHLLKLELFNGSKNLAFEEITTEFLSRYETELRKTLSENYIHALFKTLKVLFNAAKKKGLISCYPFDTYENPVYTSPVKDYLTLEELERWEKFTDTTQNPVLKQAAVYFLLGCYSGLRISDWYQFNIENNVRGDKIRLRAKKNNQWVEMLISPPLRRNLARMQHVPLAIEEPTVNEKLKEIARNDQVQIQKRITSHTGRHTFAVTICLGNKLSSETSAELMGITLKTFVDNYSQVTQLKIDSETKVAWKNLK